MDRPAAEAQGINLYDRMFEQLRGKGITTECAIDTVVEAYLDGKPACSTSSTMPFVFA